MRDWKIDDIKIVCYNLQNKITPFEAKEQVLEQQARDIRKEMKCDEFTAWQVLRNRLWREFDRIKANT